MVPVINGGQAAVGHLEVVAEVHLAGGDVVAVGARPRAVDSVRVLLEHFPVVEVLFALLAKVPLGLSVGVLHVPQEEPALPEPLAAVLAGESQTF